MLTNMVELIRNVKTGGSLGLRDPNLEGLVKSRVRTLTFRRLRFKLLK